MSGFQVCHWGFQDVQDFQEMPEEEAASFFEDVFNCLHGSGSAKLKASSSTLPRS